MTPQSILIALVAGATSVVLLAAGLTGTFLALPLMILAPLPIAITGLGWGTFIGFVAVGFAFVGLTLISTFTSGLVFAAIFGLPIAYLVHAAGLSRQDAPNQPEEWFPVGAVMVRAIVIGGSAVGLALILAGFDIDEMTKQGLVVFSETLTQLDDTSRKTMEEAIALQIMLTPYSMPMAWLLMIWLNLTLGIKIAKTSDRFKRPSFRLQDAELPMVIAPAFGVAVLISLTSPPLAHLGAAFVGIILMALIILGFNTLHVITSRLDVRSIILATTYGVTIAFAFPLLLVLGIGLADLFFKIRQRYRLANPD